MFSGHPTPYQVRPKDLVAVSEGSGGLTVWRTRVDQVCPASEADCTQLSAASEQKIPVSQVKQPTSVSVGPDGDTIAVTGNVTADAVVLLEGARFQGRIDMDRRTIAAKIAHYKETQVVGAR